MAISLYGLDLYVSPLSGSLQSLDLALSYYIQFSIAFTAHQHHPNKDHHSFILSFFHSFILSFFQPYLTLTSYRTLTQVRAATTVSLGSGLPKGS